MGNCKSTVAHDSTFPKRRLPSVVRARAASDTFTTDCSDRSADPTKSFHKSSQSSDNYEEDPVILVRRNIIGSSQEITTPFGNRKIVYADYAASGRYLQMVEDFMIQKVYPFYANTHTEASATGAITTHLREEARLIVSKSLHAPRDRYAVIFVGTGCTGAIEKMMKLLGIWLPAVCTRQEDIANLIPEEERPVVFIGPFEHHSNELPWRESIATVVVIPEDADGCPDIKVLKAKLAQYKDRQVKIGSFCAGSNVSGICIDTKKYSRVLHKHGALAFFDFAGSGAYVSIDMNGDCEDESMDAVFMSPHKFIGGPGSSGLLVAKRSIFKDVKTPTFPGGGTVSFVSPSAQDYEDDIEAREDAGTPGIVQAIRCGMAFKVKEMVGCQRIEAIEREYCKTVFSYLKQNPNVMLIGSDRGAYFDPHRRVTIMSFNIHPNRFRAKTISSSGITAALPNSCMMLHPHFVVAILNDVYGIQARAGCSCTGPYGHRLFDMVDSEIAEHGWKLIPLYQVDLKSGLFVHKRESSELNRPSLNDFQFIPSTVGVKAKIKPQSFQQVLDDAKNIYGTTDKFLRLFGGDDVGAIVESFPSGIVPQDDVWWVTTRDVMESLKGQRGISRASPFKATNVQQDAWSICT